MHITFLRTSIVPLVSGLIAVGCATINTTTSIHEKPVRAFKVEEKIGSPSYEFVVSMAAGSNKGLAESSFVPNPFDDLLPRDQTRALAPLLEVEVTEVQRCQQIRRRVVHKTEVTTREMERKDKIIFGWMYVAGTIGVGLLATGLIIGPPYSETEMTEPEPDSYEEPEEVDVPTASGGLVIFGAIGTAFLIPAIPNSFRAIDTKKDLGEEEIDEELDVVTCGSGPASGVVVRLSAGDDYLTARTDPKGVASFAASDIRDEFCPDNESTEYSLGIGNDVVSATGEIHPLCSEVNVQHDQEATLEAVGRDLGVVGDLLRSGDWIGARRLLLDLKPVTEEHRERVVILRAQMVDLILKSVSENIDAWYLREARSYLEDLEAFDLDAEQEKLAKKLGKKIDKRWRKFKRMEAREQRRLDKEKAAAEKAQEKPTERSPFMAKVIDDFETSGRERLLSADVLSVLEYWATIKKVPRRKEYGTREWCTLASAETLTLSLSSKTVRKQLKKEQERFLGRKFKIDIKMGSNSFDAYKHSEQILVKVKGHPHCRALPVHMFMGKKVMSNMNKEAPFHNTIWLVTGEIVAFQRVPFKDDPHFFYTVPVLEIKTIEVHKGVHYWSSD